MSRRLALIAIFTATCVDAKVQVDRDFAVVKGQRLLINTPTSQGALRSSASEAIKDDLSLLLTGETQRAGVSGLLAFSGMMVAGIVLGIIVILFLSWRIQLQGEEIDKLEARISGMNHQMMVDQLKDTKDAEKRKELQTQISKEEAMLKAKEMEISKEESELAHLREEITEDRRIIAAQTKEITEVTAEVRGLIDEIIAQKRVLVDLETRSFRIVEPIWFKLITVHPDTTRETVPPAEFQNPAAAMAILGDLARILEYLPNAVLMIEGHTRGGGLAVSDVGYEIATERAAKVVETLVRCGVGPHRLEYAGKPGVMGDDCEDTKIITLAW